MAGGRTLVPAETPEARTCACSNAPGEDVGGAAGAVPVPGHHGDDVRPSAPVDEPGVVTRGRDPTGLVQDGDRVREEAVDLPLVGDVGEHPEQEARVTAPEAPGETDQPSAPHRRRMHRPV